MTKVTVFSCRNTEKTEPYGRINKPIPCPTCTKETDLLFILPSGKKFVACSYKCAKENEKRVYGTNNE